MIAYLKGEVISVQESKMILDVHDVGYQLFITSRDAADMPPTGTDVRMHTYLDVKEDSMHLFGFLEEEDLESFKLLLNVNGIGPKVALAVLSTLTSDELRIAVLSEDVKTISKAPGLGSKTAKKLILELKDKMNLEDVFQKKMDESVTNKSAVVSDAYSEAVQALTALGYSNSDALQAVRKAGVEEGMDTEEILKLALKQLAFL